MNFLKETEEVIKQAGKKISDIVYIGNREIGCKWPTFRKLADFEYDDGYGSAEIPQDLVILFTDNTWLERFEYDGSECWEYKKPIVPPQKPKPLLKICGGSHRWSPELETRGKEKTP